MALKATVFKAELQVTDLERNYFHQHALTLARHPSETNERLMVRLLAFALNADDSLVFGAGLSSEEPDLWRKDLTGATQLWIEVGQPEESQLRRACGRARDVIVYSYSGRSAQLWWDKNGEALQRCKNLTVIDVAASCVASLGELAQRGMQVQCLLQDGMVQMMTDQSIVTVDLVTRLEGQGRR